MKKIILLILATLAILLVFLFLPSFSEKATEDNPNNNEERIYCNREQRNVGVCIEIYQPVCGFFDPERIQCVTYPCASTYSNNCFACQNSDVSYHIPGECPKPS